MSILRDFTVGIRFRSAKSSLQDRLQSPVEDDHVQDCDDPPRRERVEQVEQVLWLVRHQGVNLAVIHTLMSLLLFHSRFDAELSDKGVQEATAGGKALKERDYTFDVAHTSLLTRAQQTLKKVRRDGIGMVQCLVKQGNES